MHFWTQLKKGGSMLWHALKKEGEGIYNGFRAGSAAGPWGSVVGAVAGGAKGMVDGVRGIIDAGKSKHPSTSIQAAVQHNVGAMPTSASMKMPGQDGGGIYKPPGVGHIRLQHAKDMSHTKYISGVVRGQSKSGFDSYRHLPITSNVIRSAPFSVTHPMGDQLGQVHQSTANWLSSRMATQPGIPVRELLNPDLMPAGGGAQGSAV